MTAGFRVHEQPSLPYLSGQLPLLQRQPPLPLLWTPPAALEQLELREQNHLLFNDLLSLSRRPKDASCTLIWGRAGCGRTTLLQALCGYFSERQQTVALLDCALSADEIIPVLWQMRGVQLFCLDNLERAEVSQPVQEAIVSYWQQQATQGGHLVISAIAPAKKLNLLPDLHSRLKAGRISALLPLDDLSMKGALQRRAREMGVQLLPAVADYMVRHERNNLGLQMAWLERAVDEIRRTRKKAFSVPLLADARQKRESA